jgi:UDP-glucuronate 4-epimerase
MSDRVVLVTGLAGFIGFHLAQRLVRDGWSVVGLDNLNDYYDPALKLARLRELGIDYASVDQIRTASPVASTHSAVTCYIGDLADASAVRQIVATHRPSVVVNLAAQAGVRYSLEHPEAYVESNVVGFLSVLESCRQHPVEHLVYASSSSVYGRNAKIPYSETDQVAHPVSLYAATKKSNELMAYCYSHLFGIPSTGLRFFSVYGPWGRPDMAYYSFANTITSGGTIDVYNHGKLSRDFTYIDDIIESVVRLLPLPPTEAQGQPPQRVLNIGNGKPENLMDFIGLLEHELDVVAPKRFVEMQASDAVDTWADTTDLSSLISFAPSTPLSVGMKAFASWYKQYTGWRT